MGGRNCCVKNCRRRSHDYRGRKLPNGLTFHCFPAWRRHEGGQISALTQRRRKAWISAVNRNNITFHHIPSSMRVCSRHFISGKPAYEMLESDPDWLPSLHLGHGEGSSRRTVRLPLALQAKKKPSDAEKPAQRESAAGEMLQTPATAAAAAAGGNSQTQADVRRPVVPLWTDVKTLLQSVLQKKPDIGLQPGDETQEQPAAVKTNLSFRDFFREALEASLDGSSRSRTGSGRTPYKVELNFQLPPLKKETCEGSPSCLNCVRLQRRVEELEERLSGLLNEPPTQVLQNPEPVPMEEEEPAWLQPVSPPPPLQEGDQDASSSNDSTPFGPAGSLNDSSKPRPRTGRCVHRFQRAWLKMFWFLRYSPAQNLMWCHVCRLHASKAHRNMSLIKGSRMFKVHNIKKHSDSNYHKESVESHLLHECD